MSTKTLRLTATTGYTKVAPGNVKRHYATLGDLTAWDTRTPADALAGLASLVAARTQHDSSHVRVIILRGHVGIFSVDLDGTAATRHIQPDRTDGELFSSSHGSASIAEAVQSFRYHVAQLTWDGKSYASELLAADSGHAREFRSWAGWQLAYRYAADCMHLTGHEAHRYACEHPFVEPEAVEANSRDHNVGRYFDDATGAPLRSLVAPAA